MPEKTTKRRLEELDGKLADDDGPIFSTVAKLVKALGPRSRRVATSRPRKRRCGSDVNCCVERIARNRESDTPNRPGARALHAAPVR